MVLGPANAAHGCCGELEALLGQLGYRVSTRLLTEHGSPQTAHGSPQIATGPVFTHPEGRKVLFLGDFIDRGPSIPRTLKIVKAMVDAGEALAIMGNHEYNALLYHTRA